MSNNRGLAEQLPADSPTSNTNAPLARPKVMRRPAQFSRIPQQPQIAPTIVGPASAPENENLALTPPPSPAVAVPVQKLWQDDARFGIAMLTIVLLVNLALIAWLPHLRPAAPAAAAPVEETAGAVATPQTSGPLTFYTKEDGTEQVETYPLPPLRPPSGADSGPNQ